MMMIMIMMIYLLRYLLLLLLLMLIMMMLITMMMALVTMITLMKVMMMDTDGDADRADAVAALGTTRGAGECPHGQENGSSPTLQQGCVSC